MPDVFYGSERYLTVSVLLAANAASPVLDYTLRCQVGQLEAAATEQSKEFDNLRGELRDALAEMNQEKKR